MCFLGVRVLERRRRIGVEEECGVEGTGSAKDKVVVLIIKYVNNMIN